MEKKKNELEAYLVIQQIFTNLMYLGLSFMLFASVIAERHCQTPNERAVKKQRGMEQPRDQDILASSISEMAKAFQEFVEDTNRFMSVVICSRIGYEFDVTEARKNVFGELTKLPNLSMDDILKAATIVVSDPAKIEFFFSLPDNVKEVWVWKLLNGML